jgi:hypothetical protein
MPGRFAITSDCRVQSAAQQFGAWPTRGGPCGKALHGIAGDRCPGEQSLTAAPCRPGPFGKRKQDFSDGGDAEHQSTGHRRLAVQQVLEPPLGCMEGFLKRARLEVEGRFDAVAEETLCTMQIICA